MKDSAVKDEYIEDLKVKLKEITLKAENEYRKRLKAEAEVDRAHKIIDSLLEVQDFVKAPARVKQKKDTRAVQSHSGFGSRIGPFSKQFDTRSLRTPNLGFLDIYCCIMGIS